MFRVNGLDPTILLEVTSAWIGFWFYVISRLNHELWRDAGRCGKLPGPFVDVDGYLGSVLRSWNFLPCKHR